MQLLNISATSRETVCDAAQPLRQRFECQINGLAVLASYAVIFAIAVVVLALIYPCPSRLRTHCTNRTRPWLPVSDDFREVLGEQISA